MNQTDAGMITSCARCGSTRLNWRLKRVRGGGGLSQRSIVWSCKACGCGEREEPITADSGPPAPDGGVR